LQKKYEPRITQRGSAATEGNLDLTEGNEGNEGCGKLLRKVCSFSSLSSVKNNWTGWPRSSQSAMTFGYSIADETDFEPKRQCPRFAKQPGRLYG
jgi:hypothetical protein